MIAGWLANVRLAADRLTTGPVPVTTVKPAEPLTEPEVARMVVLPTATPLARPALVIVAAAVFVEVQVTELVRFWVLLSL